MRGAWRIAAAGLSAWLVATATPALASEPDPAAGPAVTNSNCGNGAIDAGEQCDRAEANGAADSCCTDACQFRSADEVCRESVGGCDAAEMCTAESAFCPEDVLERPGKVCRDATGACDRVERCSGLHTQCPEDRVRDHEAVCRSARTACDAAEFCDGELPTCPEDRKSTGICRHSRGGCDLPERCDGVREDCPPDRDAADGESCLDGNPCTEDETCKDGVCGGGTHDPFLCGAMVCTRGDTKPLAKNSAPPAGLVDGLEDGKFHWRNPKQSFFCSRAALSEEALLVSAPESPGEVAGETIEGPDPAAHRLSVPILNREKNGTVLSVVVLRDRFGTRPVPVRVPKQGRLARVVSLPVELGSPDQGRAQAALADARKCYDVRKGSAVGVKRIPLWKDDGESVLYDIKDLKRVCVPVSIDGTPVLRPDATLACYKASRSRGQAAANSAKAVEVFTPRGDRFQIGNWSSEFVCFPAEIESYRVRTAPNA